jgi:hypothetical protein
MTDRQAADSNGNSAGPRIPRAKPSWLALSYGVLGAALVAGYLLSGLFGWSFEAEEQGAIPAGVRQAPGGYRSYHLWHSGYQGGK